MKLQIAVERGGITPAVRDRLSPLLAAADETEAVVMLSQSAGRPGPCLAVAIAEALADNRGGSLGELTGLQALQRTIPGGGDDSISQLRQYMTQVANQGI